MYKSVEKQNELLALLKAKHLGAENFITSCEIEGKLDINGGTVRRIINRLRTQGNPIGSNADGYFYAENSDEVDQTIHQLLGRIKSVIRATDGLVASHKVFKTVEN